MGVPIRIIRPNQTHPYQGAKAKVAWFIGKNEKGEEEE